MLAKTRIGWLAAALCSIVGIHASHAQEGVPSALQPPAGYTVAFTAKASGVQIYKSTAENGAVPKWTFEAPLAELSAPAQAIHHYAGPSWEAADGSKIVRDTNTPVATVPAKQAATDIPWLLIKVTADSMPGLLSKIGYVQRVSTSGGAAPATPPVREGTTVGVPYTATYVFYAKSH
jgi:hypothetical protein